MFTIVLKSGSFFEILSLPVLLMMIFNYSITSGSEIEPAIVSSSRRAGKEMFELLAIFASISTFSGVACTAAELFGVVEL